MLTSQNDFSIISNIIFKKTKDIISSQYELTPENSFKLKKQTDPDIQFYSFTSSILLQGVLNIKVVLSVDNVTSRNIYRKFMGEIIISEYAKYLLLEVTSELLNTIVGNSTEDLRQLGFSFHLTTPIILNSKEQLQNYITSSEGCFNIFSNGQNFNLYLISEKYS